MAAINGANKGLGLVTLGLETDFPEDDRNTDPGIANVTSGVTYKIRNVDYTGTAAYTGVGQGEAALLLTDEIARGTTLGDAS